MKKMKSWMLLLFVTVVMSSPLSNAWAQDGGRWGGYGGHHRGGAWNGHPSAGLDRHWGHRRWDGGPRATWHQGYPDRRDRGRCWNCGAGPAIVGLAVGALLGSAMANSAPRPWSVPRGCRAIVVQGETYYNCGERDDDYAYRYRYRHYDGGWQGWQAR